MCNFCVVTQAFLSTEITAQREINVLVTAQVAHIFLFSSTCYDFLVYLTITDGS